MSAVGQAQAAGRRPGGLTAGSQGDVERIERAAFTYMWEQRDPHTGLVYNTTEPEAPASPTAAGVALSAIPIGIERGWITREEGYHRAQQLLESLHRAEQAHGFFYHFLEPASGKRTWHSEVSSIDSAIAFAGAMVSAEYFKGTDVERLANTLVDRAEWPWFLDGEDTLRWGWNPETGFNEGSIEFSEGILAYLLALGSSTHPIAPACWDALRRPITRPIDPAIAPRPSAVGGTVEQEHSGERDVAPIGADGQVPRALPVGLHGGPSLVYTSDGSLFAYLLPLAWFDLRNRHDAYLDYWSNAVTAIRANQRFCQEHRARFRTYQKGLWGLSAALGPDGYKAYGATPALQFIHDGTVAPYVVLASMPLLPELAMDTYRAMERLAPRLWTRYGPGDALNLDRRYACPYTVALDQGLFLLLIENMRTGLVWELFMRHPIAARAMALSRFVPGRLDEPMLPAIRPGNPEASLTVPMLEHAVTVDADLHEWIRDEAMELTPTNRRNVEVGFFKNAADASALIYLGWTPERFYVAGIVTDDELVVRHERDQIYQDDCVELFWDLDRDGFRFDGNPDDVQLGLAPTGPKGAWQLWAWGTLKRAPDDVQVAVQRGRNHFVFELGIPMRLLRIAPGQPVRFSIAYHDRDTTGRAGKLHWSVDTASVPGTVLFGHMTLEPSKR